MRLTEIKLAGFKSFVDPTSIRLPGQLVGIVGPNGCGKSNVMDAVRWVLGESRASALRGDSMQDVIFNGSGNRKPTARASVELVFDNSLGRAAGQWSQYAELSVKRVLQRDGESSYFINNVHVRRRDITDVFLGTGLGPRAYAIIEQGMISRVIEAKPEEVRIFLEEAAGISKYRERRKETENRLADTRENLARVSDIRGELGAQIEKLSAQAEVAARYNQLQAELKGKQLLLWYVKKRDAASEAQRCAAELAHVVNVLEEETSRVRELESRVETARGAHFSAGDALNTAQAAVYGANTEVARHESDLRHLEETRQRLETQYTERCTQLASWRHQRSQLTQALHMWASRKVSAKAKVDNADARAQQEAEHLPEVEQSFRVAQDALNQARSQLMQAESRQQLANANKSHLEREQAALVQRRIKAEDELQVLVEPDPSILSEMQRQEVEFVSRLSDLDEALRAATESASVAEQNLSAAQLAQDHASRESTVAEARLNALRQIQEATDSNVELSDWFDRHSLNHSARFWQNLNIESGWETAIEAVLRERLHATPIESVASLSVLAEDPPPVRIGFFVRGHSSGGGGIQGCIPLASKITTDDAQQLTGALNDWMARYYAVDSSIWDVDQSSIPDDAVLVDREGRQISKYTATLHAPDPSNAGLLARKAEIEQLIPLCENLGKRADDARAAAAAVAADLARLQEGISGLHHARTELQRVAHSHQLELLTRQQEVARYRERHAQLIEEKDSLIADEGLLREKASRLDEEMQEYEAGIQAAREHVNQRRDAHIASEEELAKQRLACQASERAAHAAAFEQRECDSKISEIDRSVHVIDQQIESAEREILALSEELAEDPVPPLREALEAAVEVRMACEKALGSARDVLETAAITLREFEEERAAIEARIAPIRDRIGELKLKEQAAQINRQQFESQLLEADADEILLEQEAKNSPRPSQLQSELTRLGQSIAELGAVNLVALEELGTSSERKKFLDSQAADLEEAVRTLEDAIRKIDKETRQLLRDTYESVNRHFGSLFPALFGGGEARLILSGEEILDSGIQIIAQPPGKKNSSIHLLSGGEKALTAIALVFSLFQLNPAPFCLLDEVDAPLDDSNTVRFRELVRRMSQQTQFLFISHNKITMELAEQLIGVTMPESGVSRVVAVDIEQALQIREELAA